MSRELSSSGHSSAAGIPPSCAVGDMRACELQGAGSASGPHAHAGVLAHAGSQRCAPSSAVRAPPGVRATHKRIWARALGTQLRRH